MPAQKQVQQTDKPVSQVRKRLLQRRTLTVIIILAILFIFFGILSTLNIISGSLAAILSLIFTIIGVAFGIYTYLFPPPSPPGAVLPEN